MNAPAEHDGRFVKVPKHVLSRRDLSASAKLIYAVLLDRIGDNDAAWPGWRRLARDLGVSLGVVSRGVCHLKRVGLLTVEARGPGQSNRYRRSESATETGALPRRERSRNGAGGATKTGAQALPKRARNQIDPLNQTHNGHPRQRRRPSQPEHRQPFQRTRRQPSRWSVADVLRIYEAYPDQTDKSDTLKAIRASLDRIAGRDNAPDDPVAWLFERTQRYAVIYTTPTKAPYIAGPRKWFSEERYNRHELDSAQHRTAEAQPGRVRSAGYKGIGRVIRPSSPQGPSDAKDTAP